MLEFPVNKTVILGLIPTNNAQLEDEDVLKERILKTAEIIAEGSVSKEEALKQIGISLRCGFSSIVEAPHVGGD